MNGLFNNKSDNLVVWARIREEDCERSVSGEKVTGSVGVVGGEERAARKRVRRRVVVVVVVRRWEDSLVVVEEGLGGMLANFGW